MNPERLIYTYVSTASLHNTSWGHGTPDEGVDRTAATAHKYGIPVTWIVNSGSIQVLGDRIRKWHEEYGDDVILKCPNYYRDAGKSKEKLHELLQQEWDILKAAFPWEETKVAGRLPGDMGLLLGAGVVGWYYEPRSSVGLLVCG